MAIVKYKAYAVGDSNIDNLGAYVNALGLYKEKISFTNESTANKPVISVGSLIEISGDVYVFTSDTTPSGEVDGSSTPKNAYIRCTPSGSSLTIEMTDTAPVYNTALQGWYGTGAYSGAKYIDRGFYAYNTSAYDRYMKLAKAFSPSELSHIKFYSDIYITAGAVLNISIGASGGAVFVTAGGLYRANTYAIYNPSSSTNTATFYSSGLIAL